MKYTFSVPTTVTEADVTITANQYAKLVNVAGNALSIPYINVWSDTSYTLSSEEETTITVEVRSQLYVDDVRTPNAKKTYTVSIYKSSNNTEIGEVIVMVSQQSQERIILLSMRLQFRQILTEAIQEQKTLQLSQYIHQAVLQKSQ